MNLKRSLIATAACALLAFPLSADDFSFDDFGGEAGEGAAAAAPALEVHGDLTGQLRAGISENSLEDLGDLEKENDAVSYKAASNLELSYAGETFDSLISLNLDTDRLDEDLAELFDEAYVRYYAKGFDLEAGLMKVVWGKGDQLHVVDHLNSNDLSDLINPDYIDRRNAVPMAKVNIPLGMQGKLEAVYVPTLTPDTIPTEGAWVPGEAQALKEIMENQVEELALNTYLDIMNSIGNAEVASLAQAKVLQEYADGAPFFPNTNTLDYGQAATRITGSFAGIDLGASYYFGFNKRPSAVFNGSGALEGINYDRLHSFGLEAGGILAGFNLRSEAAYYMTEDLDGDDPAVHNNSFNYLAGFDRDLPLSNLNINFQVKGSIIMNHDEIVSPLDVEGSSDQTNTMLVAKLSDSYNHEKVKAELKAIYEIEDEDFMINPALFYKPSGDIEFCASASFFGGEEDGLLGQFKDQSFLELSTKIFF